jgi:hypothetical protein
MELKIDVLTATVSSFETSDKATKPYDATYQKTAVFIEGDSLLGYWALHFRRS